MVFHEEDVRQQQVEAIADVLQELMANEDSALKAKQSLVDAVNCWYDYHYKEMEKWSSLKRLLERPL